MKGHRTMVPEFDDERRPLLWSVVVGVPRRLENDDPVAAAAGVVGSYHGYHGYHSVQNEREEESTIAADSTRIDPQGAPSRTTTTTRNVGRPCGGGTTWWATTTVLLVLSMIMTLFFHSHPGLDHVLPFPGIHTLLLGAAIVEPEPTKSHHDGTSNTTTKTKKGGKVVVVQVIKLQFPQQPPTGPYGYPYYNYYPPPPGYYNNNYYGPPPLSETQQQQQQQQPVVTTEKPTDQEWKKYQEKYVPSKDETKNNNNNKRQDETKATTENSPPSSSPSSGSSSSPSLPDQNVSDAAVPTTIVDRRAATAPYNWQQWTTQGATSGTSSSGGGSNNGGTSSNGGGSNGGGTYDWQQWTTNSNTTTPPDSTSASSSNAGTSPYDWHQWVDKDKDKSVAAPSTVPSYGPTQLPSNPPVTILPTASNSFDLSSPVANDHQIGPLHNVEPPSHEPSSMPNPGITAADLPKERSTTLPTPSPSLDVSSPSSMPTNGPASSSPSGVLMGGRFLEETFAIDVNVPCKSAFLEPVFHDFVVEQRVAHTLADQVGLEEARQIAAHLYEEETLGDSGPDGHHTVVMYVDYDDDAHTADMVLVHGFDIFDNYREHYEFIPVPTTTTTTTKTGTRGKHRAAAADLEPPTCRIVRTLSATLTDPGSLGNITGSQWLLDHDGDMLAFRNYVESTTAESLSTGPLTAPTLNPISPKHMHKADGAPPLTPIPTPEPIPRTDAPTLVPTTAPISTTMSPTVSSTLVPTTAPTFSPTVSPTEAPTDAPTITPTGTPTDPPTVTPTYAPTYTPTVAPTFTPTTHAPSAAPTIAPAATPTPYPSPAPTTSTPTVAPVSPTSAPLAPTKSPRRKHTSVAPTLEPSVHSSSIHSKRKHKEVVHHF